MGALAEKADAEAVASAAPFVRFVMGTWLALFLALAVAIIVALPPEYDPAIRLRQWLDERRK